MQDRAGDHLDDLRIEVGLGLIPEERSLVHKRAGRDQPRDHGQLSKPLGDEVHLHTDPADTEIEPAGNIQLDLAPHHLFERREQGFDASFARASRQGRAEQDTSVPPGLFERQVSRFIKRHEAWIDRQQLASGQIDGQLVDPGRRGFFDRDIRLARGVEREGQTIVGA